MLWNSTRRSVCALVFLTMAVAGFAHVAAADDLDPAWLAQSVVDAGNFARLHLVVAKAARGEPIKIASIGGSITAGASASSEENRWPNRAAAWWRTRYPQTQVHFLNAGIGATGSDIGAHRIRQDVLAAQPDVVMIEFAVNDSGSTIAGETLEGLLRQVLAMPNHPAAVMLFTMNDKGQNVQQEHSRVGLHYRVPMVSFRDAVWPDIVAGKVAWNDIEADSVHPNDRGHEICGALVGHIFEMAAETSPADERPGIDDALPDPLISDTYQYTAVHTAGTLVPVRAGGWQTMKGAYGQAWRAETPGSVLELDIEGTAIGLAYKKQKTGLGRVSVVVNDGPPRVLDGYFPQDWGGGYTPFVLLGSQLPAGRHRVTLTVLDERAEESPGYAFEVHAFYGAGLQPAPADPCPAGDGL